MIRPVSNSGTLFTARQAMSKAMQKTDAAAKKLAAGEINAENMVELEIARKNMQAQRVSMEAALQAAGQVLDIIVK